MAKTVTLLKESALPQIITDLENAVEADRLLAQQAKTAAEAAMDKSQQWAEKAENSPVETGKYSALHWAAKAEDEKLAAEVFKNKADKFANENEDTEVEAGKFSAKHYSIKAAAQNAQMGAVYPTAAYRSRVLTDSGNIQDLNKLTELYIKNLQLLPNTVFLWDGSAGMKTRTSGSNQFASKLYNMANLVQQFGSELVTNGVFTGADGSTPAGWTGIRTTLAVDTNRLKLTSTETSTNAYAYQAITTIIGKTYHLSYAITTGTLAGSMYIGTTVGGGQIFTDIGFNGTKTISFVATATTTYVNLMLFNNTLGQYAFFDNISVKQMDWVAGTNDAVQATEANQPYVGGVIAPNEVRKTKNDGLIKYCNISSNVFAANENFSLTVVFNYRKNSNYIQTPIFCDNNSIGFCVTDDSLNNFGFRLHDPDYDLYNFGVSSRPFLNTNTIASIVKIGDILSFYLNGEIKSSAVITNNTPFIFKIIGSYTNAASIQGIVETLYAQIHNRALSASEIQAQHEYLRSQIPEIEGVAIGNQYWTTSNYEGVVAGDGSVIQEVQEANNVEKVVNGGFDSDTSWVKGTGWIIDSGLAQYDGTGGTSFIAQSFNIKNSYYYKVVIDVSENNGTGLNSIFFGSQSISAIHLPTGITTIYVKATVATGSTTFNIYGRAGEVFKINSVSIEEVGWSQSTALYDAIYAQTTGSAQVKELAALKAAAMWCYYDNNVNNGAIYGKLYNWYAVKLISLYPPTGWRVPTSADFLQLQAYLGGSTVSGGKMKVGGLTYWNSPNTGATNESGFSSIGSGRRSNLGTFNDSQVYNLQWSSTDTSATDASRVQIFYLDSTSFITPLNKIWGGSIRLIRNSPVGDNEELLRSTFITTDIASTANSTVIKHGYSVSSVRVKTTANLTNIKVELWNNYWSGTPALVATLITGKTCNNTTMVFPVLADYQQLLQDGTLRITATGASGFETEVMYNIQKNVL